MENLPSILTPDLGLLFWMLLAFLVVFFVVAKFGFPVIIGMVENRKQYIDESLKKAHEASERLANIQKEGETMLQEARQKQAQILKEAKTSTTTFTSPSAPTGLTPEVASQTLSWIRF